MTLRDNLVPVAAVLVTIGIIALVAQGERVSSGHPREAAGAAAGPAGCEVFWTDIGLLPEAVRNARGTVDIEIHDVDGAPLVFVVVCR